VRWYVMWMLFACITLLPICGHAADTYVIDPDHSAVVFRIKHIGITFVYGVFSGAKGEYRFDSAVPENAAITVRVRVADVDTGNEKRDRHLRSPDFFDEKKFPYITFVSRSISAIDENRYSVSGELSLHGVTRPVTVTAFKTGSSMDSRGRYRSGFESHFSVQRSEYGMQYMTGLADRVHLTIRVEGLRKN